MLASLPERDRIGQLRRMADELEAMFGRRPRGAWLAERVWEPDLPTSLVAAGYDWTILDDAHFRAAAIPEDDLWGPYTTEDQGQLLRRVRDGAGLRYRIPFREVDEVIDYLRDHATDDGERVGMMGDDGEKFGAWPTTWEHCWGERRWVERFFEALEANADWLTTTTPSAWLADHPPIGRVYIPTGLVRRDGRVGAAARRGPRFEEVLTRPRRSTDPRRAGCAARSGATSRSSTARSTTSTSRCCGSPRRSRRCRMARPATRRSTTSTAASRTTATGTGCSAGIYISHMRLAT